MALLPGSTVLGTESPQPSQSSLKEFETVSDVRNLFYRARDFRRPLVQRWNRNYAVLNNRTWLGVGRPSWKPSPEVPEVKPIISALVGWMTDQRAQLDVSPSAEPFTPYTQFYQNLAQDLNTVLDSTWQIEDYDEAVETCLFDGFTYGTGILKTTWDNQLHGGLGNAVLKRVDPYTFYPDPDARDMRSANYFIEARTISLQDMERRWPGSTAKVGISAGSEGVDEAPTVLSEVQTSLPKANPGAISPATSPRYGLPGQSGQRTPVDAPGITVFECWIRQPKDTELDDPESDNPDDKITTPIDHWRCIVVAGNTVLMDEWATDMWDHGDHPYSRFVLESTGEFWGPSMVELLSSCQISINRLLAAVEQNIELMGNPVFVEDTRAAIARQQITNKPGTRIRKTSNSTAEWLNPPQMHPQMTSDLIRFYIGEMERISGLSAIVRGATPTGRNAEGVLDSVQEAAFVRIRLALRNLERTLRNVGNKVAGLITEFYDSPRVVAIVGDSGFQSWLALKGHHFYTQTPDGRVPMKFQLIVEAGSSQPQSQSAREGKYNTLFAMGAIDEEALLEVHRIPNWQVVAKRVQEKKIAGLMQPPGSRARSGRKS